MVSHSSLTGARLRTLNTHFIFFASKTKSTRRPAFLSLCAICEAFARSCSSSTITRSSTCMEEDLPPIAISWTWRVQKSHGNGPVPGSSSCVGELSMMSFLLAWRALLPQHTPARLPKIVCRG